MKQIISILILAIIDFIIIWLYYYYQDPDPSVSIALIIIIPSIILVNIIIAGILWFFKKNKLSQILLLNSLIASIIAYFLWDKAIERHQNRIWEIYSFEFKNKKYQININKPDDIFGITESANPGSSWTYQDGIIKRQNETIILETDSTKYIIKNDSISGFTKNKIKLQRE